MFPTATSTIYRNEDGEVLGWDSGSYYDEPEYDPYDEYGPDPMDEPDEDDEPDRCEADHIDGKVCGVRLEADGECRHPENHR